MVKVRSNAEWEQWGDIDPKWAVAAHEGKQANSADAWQDDEFYELGKLDWADFFSEWEKYGINTESCVEIGSGAGRMTKQLATTFGTVHGLDVSQGMLDYAKDRVFEENINWHLTNGATMPLADQSVTAAFSCHVLQHLDNLDIARIQFAELARVLKPGGSLMIHVPMHAWPYNSGLHARIHAVRSALSDIKVAIRRSLTKLGLASPGMRGLSYPVEFFYQALPELGFEDIRISTFALKSNGAPHTCVMARRG